MKRDLCTNRPNCLCEFCIAVRRELRSGKSAKDEIDNIAKQFLASLQVTGKAAPATGNLHPQPAK